MLSWGGKAIQNTTSWLSWTSKLKGPNTFHVSGFQSSSHANNYSWPRSKKLFARTKKKNVIQTRQIKHSESIWIWFVSIRFQTASQPNTLAEAQFLLFPGISNQSLLCYLIYSCVLSCTSSTFPHVIIPSLGLFSSNKNHFNQTETFFMSADTKLQPRTRCLQSIGQACRWLRSISPCFAVA